MFTRRHFERRRNQTPPGEGGVANIPISGDRRRDAPGGVERPTTVTGQLSDDASTLSRFLLRGADDVTGMKSMGDINAAWYALGEACVAGETRRARLFDSDDLSRSQPSRARTCETKE